MTVLEPPTAITVTVDVTPKDAAVIQRLARRSKVGRRNMWQFTLVFAVGIGLLAVAIVTASGVTRLAAAGAYVALLAAFMVLNRQLQRGLARSLTSTTYVLDPISVTMVVTIGQASGSVSARWQDLSDVTVSEDHVVLHYEEIRLGLIPRRCFRTTDDEQQVIRWISEARSNP